MATKVCLPSPNLAAKFSVRNVSTDTGVASPPELVIRRAAKRLVGTALISLIQTKRHLPLLDSAGRH
jgi:hypothetical protein